MQLEELSLRDRMTGMLNLKGLSRKLVSSQRYACVLLKIQWMQTATSSVTMHPELFVANALQMNCSEREFCFRYNKDTFGVMLPLPDRMGHERCCEEWVLRFDAFTERLRQIDKHLEKPVIVMYYDQFQSDDDAMSEVLEQLIKSHLQQNHPAPTFTGGMIQRIEEIRRQIIARPAVIYSVPDFILNR